jgi:hypothetical protein
VDLPKVFSDMNEFKESLGEQFKVHVDRYTEVFFLEVANEKLILFATSLSLLVWSLVSCFL